MTNNTVDVEYLSGVAFTVVTFRQGYDMDEVEDLLESLKPSVSIVDRQEKVYEETDFPMPPLEIRGKINELTKVSFQPAYDIIEVQQIVVGAAERAEEWLAQCQHERQEELDRIEAERLEQELIERRESERIAAEQEAVFAAERAEQRRVERQLEAEHRKEEQAALSAAPPLPPIPVREPERKPQHAREAYKGEEVESSRSLLELIAYLHYVTEKGGERGAQFSVVSSMKGGYFGVQSITIDPNSRQVVLDAQGMNANEALTVSELASQLREIRDQNKNFGLYQIAVWGRFGIQGIKSLEIATDVGIVVIRTN